MFAGGDGERVLREVDPEGGAVPERPSGAREVVAGSRAELDDAAAGHPRRHLCHGIGERLEMTRGEEPRPRPDHLPRIAHAAGRPSRHQVHVARARAVEGVSGGADEPARLRLQPAAADRTGQELDLRNHAAPPWSPSTSSSRRFAGEPPRFAPLLAVFLLRLPPRAAALGEGGVMAASGRQLGSARRFLFDTQRILVTPMRARLALRRSEAGLRRIDTRGGPGTRRNRDAAGRDPRDPLPDPQHGAVLLGMRDRRGWAVPAGQIPPPGFGTERSVDAAWVSAGGAAQRDRWQIPDLSTSRSRALIGRWHTQGRTSDDLPATVDAIDTTSGAGPVRPTAQRGRPRGRRASRGRGDHRLGPRAQRLRDPVLSKRRSRGLRGHADRGGGRSDLADAERRRCASRAASATTATRSQATGSCAPTTAAGDRGWRSRRRGAEASRSGEGRSAAFAERAARGIRRRFLALSGGLHALQQGRPIPAHPSASAHSQPAWFPRV